MEIVCCWQLFRDGLQRCNQLRVQCIKCLFHANTLFSYLLASTHSLWVSLGHTHTNIRIYHRFTFHLFWAIKCVCIGLMLSHIKIFYRFTKESFACQRNRPNIFLHIFCSSFDSIAQCTVHFIKFIGTNDRKKKYISPDKISLKWVHTR